MGDSSDSDPEFDKDDPYCFDPDWEDCYALASDVQGGPDEQSSSDEEDKAGDGSGATNDAEPVCVCQNCRYVTYTGMTRVRGVPRGDARASPLPPPLHPPIP